MFPEGDPGSARAPDAPHPRPTGELRLDPDRLAGAPDGYVAYSKVCTHAGCPVGLYLASEQHLVCPCHQSTFDVLDGATPDRGPGWASPSAAADRVADDGTFTALGDFPEPVGPALLEHHLVRVPRPGRRPPAEARPTDAAR